MLVVSIGFSGGGGGLLLFPGGGGGGGPLEGASLSGVPGQLSFPPAAAGRRFTFLLTKVSVPIIAFGGGGTESTEVERDEPVDDASST